MRSRLIPLLAFLLITTMPVHPASAQAIPPGIAGTDQYGHGLYVTPNLTLAISYGKLYKRVDKYRWVLVPTPDGNVSQISVRASDDLYIVVESNYQYRLYRSSDLQTWTLQGPVPAPNADATGIYASPAPGVVFATVRGFSPMDYGQGYGFQKSSDGGVTWRLVLGNSWGGHIVFSPDFAQDGTAFTVPRFYHGALGVWKTTDGGETWVDTNAPSGMAEGCTLAISPGFVLDRTVFYTCSGRPTYKSTDAGNTWQQVLPEPNGLGVNVVAMSPNYLIDHTVMVAECKYPPDLIWLSHDGGQTWQEIQVNLQIKYATMAVSSPGQMEYWFAAYTPPTMDSWFYRASDPAGPWSIMRIVDLSRQTFFPLVGFQGKSWRGSEARFWRLRLL